MAGGVYQQHRDRARPVSWLGAAAAMVFTLLMLYVPFFFYTPTYRTIYPYLRWFGSIFGVAGLLQVFTLVGLGLPRWLTTASRLLLAAVILVFTATLAVHSGAMAGLSTYGLLSLAIVAVELFPGREPTIMEALFIAVSTSLGGLLVLRSEFVPIPAQAGDPRWPGAILLVAALCRLVALLSSRRPREMAVAVALLSAVPLAWFAVAFAISDHWVGACLHALFVLAILGWGLYQRRPWLLRIAGLRWRILIMAVGLSTVPLLVLGAIGVYTVQRLDREDALDDLMLSARQAEIVAQRLIVGLPIPVANLAGLNQAAARIVNHPDHAPLILPLEDTPANWGAGPEGALEEGTNDGRRRLVAYIRRPDLGLTIAVTRGLTGVFGRADGLAGVILGGTLLIAAGVVLGSLPLAGRVTRQLSIVKEVAASIGAGRFSVRAPVSGESGDEVADLATTINAMAATLEDYSGELQVRNAALRAQAEQLQEQNRLLAAARAEEVQARQQLEVTALEVQRLNSELEQRVRERTAELAAAVQELESFSYSVSHDLRAPLRTIDGFSQAILEDSGDRLDPEGHDFLRRIRGAAQQMGQLIDSLLQLSRVTRGQMHRETVDLSTLARGIAAELQQAQPGRLVSFTITDGLVAYGDPRLLRVALANLLSNAWKFTAPRPQARIEFGVAPQGAVPVYFVRDNGVGFEMSYADKLFHPFERLHPEKEFAGSGIGLATVQRIVQRHGGHIWAESGRDQGATFYFTLAATVEG